MTAKIGSTLHVQYLDGLPLPLLIGRRIDVSMDERKVKAARLVPDDLALAQMTKAQQQERFARIATAYEIGDSIVGSDFDFLFALLCRHPRFEGLIGPGVRRIRARDRSGFEVVRVDGSCVGFSSGKGVR